MAALCCKLNQILIYVLLCGVIKCASDITGPARNEVTVITLQWSYEKPLHLDLHSNLEYIIEYTPTAEQALWPTRVRLVGANADTVRPILITARQTTGATTWQLPWTTVTGELSYELERTLCPLHHNVGGEESLCVGEETTSRGVFLHVGSTCTTPSSLDIRVSPVRDWLLGFRSTTEAFINYASPKSFLYLFLPDQDKVRLILSSESDFCALVSIQNYTCPLIQNEADLVQVGQRMTMMKSAGLQLTRKTYPMGFYVVMILRSSDETCIGTDDAEGDDWLGSEAIREVVEIGHRNKTISVRIEPALTRSQYAVASLVTVVVFLFFYIVCVVFILAQRSERFLRYVGPMEPEENTHIDSPHTEITSIVDNPLPMRRRPSNLTLDSSDNSDTDESDCETTFGNSKSQTDGRDATPTMTPAQEPPLNGNEVQTQVTPVSTTPFGLPSQLRLAVLSRHRSKVLRVRSDRYLWTLITVAVFYALPVVQFMAGFQFLLNVSGSLDICYYNYLCAHPVGYLSDFNHVFSNVGYLMLGTLFILQVYRRRRRRRTNPRNEEYGIPPHYGFFNSLGVGMMVVALLSASYHVCPNALNFQFDTAFMYVLAVLMMVKVYQSRHPDVNARAHATFGVLAVIIALGVFGVLGGGPFFWALFTVLHLFTFLMLSLRIYYVGQFKLEIETFSRAARGIASMPNEGIRPLYKTRLIMVFTANCLNWTFALYGLWTQSEDFASHLLMVLLANAMLYMTFYLIMKLLHGERPRWYAWCFLAGAVVTWVPALYFFKSGSTSWSSTPAESRHMNHECKILLFYDNHDLWHFLSAIALYFTFNTLLTWDDGLTAVKRTDIAVF